MQPRTEAQFPKMPSRQRVSKGHAFGFIMYCLLPGLPALDAEVYQRVHLAAREQNPLFVRVSKLTSLVLNISATMLLPSAFPCGVDPKVSM
jgi:hypothetical protein